MYKGQKHGDRYVVDDSWLAGGEHAQKFGLWQIMVPVRGQIIVAMLLSGFSALFMLSSLLCLAWSVRQLWAFLGLWPTSVLAAAFGCTIGSYVTRLLAFNASHYAAFRLETVLRILLTRRISQLSLGTVQSLGVGALSKIIQDDVKSLHVFVADSTPLYARAVLTPLLTLGILLWLNWQLALAAIAVLLIGGGVMRFARRNAVTMYQRYRRPANGSVVR
ncbi:ABC transporter transmembrane domain-containing protein [Vibrio sp. PP-XX7]